MPDPELTSYEQAIHKAFKEGAQDCFAQSGIRILRLEFEWGAPWHEIGKPPQYTITKVTATTETGDPHG